jgi:hypothetical protein
LSGAFAGGLLKENFLMHVERHHKVTQSEAVQRIDKFLEGLKNGTFPGGITVVDTTKKWTGNTMNFSFNAKKWFVQVTISGLIEVKEHSVILDCELPPLVSKMVSENEISRVVGQQFDQLFPE